MAAERLLAIVEIPKGSRNKYEWDEEAGLIVLSRFVSSSTVYPTDYGFLAGYEGEDGDPLDCLVCVSEPSFPGCGIEVKPVALFRMRDEAGADDKVVCVPLHDPGWSEIEDLDDLPRQLRREVEHFFSVYKDLEDKRVEIGGWQPGRRGAHRDGRGGQTGVTLSRPRLSRRARRAGHLRPPARRP